MCCRRHWTDTPFGETMMYFDHCCPFMPEGEYQCARMTPRVFWDRREPPQRSCPPMRIFMRTFRRVTTQKENSHVLDDHNCHDCGTSVGNCRSLCRSATARGCRARSPMRASCESRPRRIGSRTTLRRSLLTKYAIFSLRRTAQSAKRVNRRQCGYKIRIARENDLLISNFRRILPSQPSICASGEGIGWLSPKGR